VLENDVSMAVVGCTYLWRAFASSVARPGEDDHLALEELGAALTRAAREAWANGYAMLARGVEAVRERPYRVARKGRTMKQHDDRRSGRLSGSV
jgi:hypothetical protein